MSLRFRQQQLVFVLNENVKHFADIMIQVVRNRWREMQPSSEQLRVNNREVTIPAPNQQHVPPRDRCCEEKPAAEILTEVCRSSTRHPQVGWSSGGGGGRATSCLSASQESLVVVQIQQMQAAPSRYVAMCTYVDLWRSLSRSPGGSFLHREPPEWPSGNQSRWLIKADRRDAEETDQGETNCCSQAFITILLLPHQSLPLSRPHHYGNHQS